MADQNQSQSTNRGLDLWYFGTDATSHGHYHWSMGEQYMTQRYNGKYLSHDDFPFSPEALALKDQNINNYMKGTGLKKGDARFFQIKGYSIWYVEGSAKDDRGGTKSVWWVKGDVSKEVLKEIILANRPSQILIKQMKEKMNFEINWDYDSNKG